MRLLCTAIVLFFSTFAIGQTVTHTPAKVLDFGQLYSTFNWDEATTQELTTALGAALAANVVAASVESAWPSGIASLEGRTENRPQMVNYKLYYLTTVDGKAVMLAPAAENRHLPATLQPANDIYFLLSSSAVEINGQASPKTTPPASVPMVASGSFQDQMNVLVNGYADGFIMLTGGQIDEDEDGLVIQYESTVVLENAVSGFFLEDLLSATTSFHAEYPGSTDPKVALKTYLQLISKVEALKLKACKLSKNKEEVEGNVRSQVFQAYDPAGNLALAYQHMNIEVRIVQGETVDKSGKTVSDWYVMLEVYER